LDGDDGLAIARLSIARAMVGAIVGGVGSMVGPTAETILAAPGAAAASDEGTASGEGDGDGATARGEGDGATARGEGDGAVRAARPVAIGDGVDRGFATYAIASNNIAATPHSSAAVCRFRRRRCVGHTGRCTCG